jgi:hypothetical protein
MCKTKNPIWAISIITLVAIILSICTLFSFAYGTPERDEKTDTFFWFVADDVPRLISADCASILTQYAMISGQYIGFHEANKFAYTECYSAFDDIDIIYGFDVEYYKGSTYLGEASFGSCSCDSHLLDGDWDSWQCRDADAEGLLGEGIGTYNAKASTTYVVDDSINVHTLFNSVSFTVD